MEYFQAEAPVKWEVENRQEAASSSQAIPFVVTWSEAVFGHRQVV